MDEAFAHGWPDVFPWMAAALSIHGQGTSPWMAAALSIHWDGMTRCGGLSPQIDYGIISAARNLAAVRKVGRHTPKGEKMKQVGKEARNVDLD